MIKLLFKLMPIGIMIYSLQNNLEGVQQQLGDFFEMANRAQTQNKMGVVANELGGVLVNNNIPRRASGIRRIMEKDMPEDAKTDFAVDAWEREFKVHGSCTPKKGKRRRSSSLRKSKKDDCYLVSAAQDGEFGTEDDIAVQIVAKSKFAVY